jgi:hypothetical protein
MCLYVLSCVVCCELSYVRYLCLFENSGVQHILCCVSVLFIWGLVYFMFSVSLDFPFLIAISVFSNIYLLSVCVYYKTDIIISSKRIISSPLYSSKPDHVEFNSNHSLLGNNPVLAPVGIYQQGWNKLY